MFNFSNFQVLKDLPRVTHSKIKVIHVSSQDKDSGSMSKDCLLKTSKPTEYGDYWASERGKIRNQHMTFDLGETCLVKKVLMMFTFHKSEWNYKGWLPKDIEIKLPISSSLPIDTSDQNWKSVEKFTNLKTQKDLGHNWATFTFKNTNVQTRFVRIFIKNNLGNENYILIGRVKFE